MDKKREKLKKFIEDSDISVELKGKELEIVNNENLTTPEVVLELTRLIAESFDRHLEEAGVNEIPSDDKVEVAFRDFEAEVEKAEKDLEEDLNLVRDNLEQIKKTAEELEQITVLGQ